MNGLRRNDDAVKNESWYQKNRAFIFLQPDNFALNKM
jgi:hypothetical protein